MTACDRFQDQLLDYLYGLLDPSEVGQLTEHLQGCGDCRGALARAERQKRLLAEAARLEFPRVRFERPVVPASSPVESPAVRTLAAEPSWGRWALAAAILIAVGGLSLAGNAYWGRHDRVVLAKARTEQVRGDIERLSRERVAKLEAADREIRTLQQESQKLNTEYQQAWVQVNQRLAGPHMRMHISGPAAAEAGALNEFHVRVYDQNRPVPAEVTAKVLDQNKNELVSDLKAKPQGVGNYYLALPRDLPARPNSDLFLVVSAKGDKDKAAQGEVTEKLTLVPPVYLTHLATDKPMYQPGEVVHFRSLTVERFSLKPAQEELRLRYTLTKPTQETVEIATGSSRVVDGAKGGQPILGPDKEPVRGVGAGEFTIPADAPGGEYTLTVSDAGGRFPPQTRKFIVNQYEKSRLNKKLEFDRKSYGPGDTVVANARALQAETNRPVADRPVTATVRLDGPVIQTLALKTNAAGEVRVQFRLPARIDKGVGSLSVTFNDGGSVEPIVRTIPIVLNKLQVEFFPEGGDLVAGVPNRVYFQARTMLDKPAELKGRIVDGAGQVQATAETLNDPKEPGINQGMGRFEFTPQAGKTYELKIDSPAGIEGKFTLPPVKGDGVVLAIPTGVTTDQEPIRVRVTSAGADRHLLVGAYCRGRLMTHQRIDAAKGKAADVELRPEAGAGGVYRVTVFEEQPGNGDATQLTPRAERLIYRVPAHRLKLTVQPDKTEYAPGEKVTLRYQAADEADKPEPAVLMVAVVDKRVIETTDEKTYRSMPTHFLLTTEVRKAEDLEYADVLLGKHPKAAQALDLLLGTQGWRRFAEQHRPEEFRRKDVQEATRLLASSGRISPTNLGPKVTDSDVQARQQVAEEYQAKLTALRDRAAQAQHHQAEAQAESQRLLTAVAKLQEESGAADREYQAAVQQLDEFQRLFRQKVLPALFGVLILGALVGLAMTLRRFGWRPSLPYLAAAAGVTLVLGIIIAYQVRPGVSFPAGEQRMAALEEQRMDALGETTKTHASLEKDQKVEPASAPTPTAPAPAAAVEEELLRGKDGTNRLADQERNFRFAVPEGRPGVRDLPTGTAAPVAAKPGQGMAPPGPGMAPPVATYGTVNGPMPGGAATKARAAAGAKAPEGGKAGWDPKSNLIVEVLEQAKEKKNQEQRDLFMRALPGMAQKKQAAKLQEEAPMRQRLPGAGPAPLDRAMQELAKPGTPPLGIPLGEIPPADAFVPFGVGGFDREVDGQPNAAERKGENGFRGPRRAGALGRFGYLAAPPAPLPPLVVREYAHQRVHGEGDVRADFTETLFWNPVLVLPDGKGESSFELCDSTTTFQVLAAGHTLDGRLGAVTTEFTARKPLTLEPKLPIEVTAGDTIDVPLALANNTANAQAVRVSVQPTGLALLSGKADDRLTLQAHQRNRLVYRFQPALVEGDAQLRFDGASGPFTDSILRPIKVVPEGFPVVGAQSDMLEKAARHELVLPESWIKGTLKYQVTVYPSTLAELQKGLESLLREPNGCFEQTSSSNYPNLLILDYLRETDQAKPEVRKRAEELLARGYRKLTSFECLNAGKNQREGYEWFGGTAPPHEALTAYGLLEFRDMARVYPVDGAMVQRTKNYLLSRRDGKGGFLRNPRAVDHFGRAPDQITNAYIVWALTESGKEDDVTRELNALVEQAKTSKDPYFLALVANSLLNRDGREQAVAILKKLVEGQQPDGHLNAERTSITGSGGRDLQIETTALTLLAWLKTQRPDLFNVPLQKAVQWLGRQRGTFGGYGSTQSTILALKALIAYARANKKTAEAGELALYVGDEAVARRPFAAGVQEALVLELPEPEKYLKPGKNDLRVEVTGRSVFPYTAGWTYRSLKPVSAAGCPVGLTTRLDRQTATEGETVGLTVALENRSGKGQGMVVAIIGLPAGLTLPEDMKQLKDLARLRNNGTERGTIDAWETRGRELILYWRDLAPDKKIDLHLDLICRVPGEYRGPASRGYLYYNADHKFWVEPLRVVIKPKADH